MKNFLSGAVTAFLTSGAVIALAQSPLNDYGTILRPDVQSYPINYINAIANAITPSGKIRGIQSDEEGRVICAR
jgi:hypothetical protein